MLMEFGFRECSFYVPCNCFEIVTVFYGDGVFPIQTGLIIRFCSVMHGHGSGS